MKENSPRFYFSFRSPYAWIASRRLEELPEISQYGLKYIPVWEPDSQTMDSLIACGGELLYVPMSKHKLLYILQDVKRLAAKYGYKMRWPIDYHPWWDLPHLAYLLAKQQGKGEAFFHAVYQARWEEGQDICAADTIRHLAAKVGLDPDQIVAAPSNLSIRELGGEMLYQAYKDGAFGFPFFVSPDGRQRFWGSDRLDDFIISLSTSS